MRTYLSKSLHHILAVNNAEVPKLGLRDEAQALVAKAFVGSSPTLCTNGTHPLHYGKNRETVINFLIYLNSRGLRINHCWLYSSP